MALFLLQVPLAEVSGNAAALLQALHNLFPAAFHPAAPQRSAHAGIQNRLHHLLIHIGWREVPPPVTAHPAPLPSVLVPSHETLPLQTPAPSVPADEQHLPEYPSES